MEPGLVYTVFMKIDIPSMFQGRIGVKDFWKAYAIGFALNLFLGVIGEILVLLPQEIAIVSFVLLLAVLILSLIVFVAFLGLTVRRLHDLNHSGWWTFAPIGFFALFTASNIFLSSQLIFFPSLILFILASLGFVIYISFFRGKLVENKYGAQGKYASWLRAYFGNQENEKSEEEKNKTFRSKFSYDAVLIGSLTDAVASSLVGIALLPYLFNKYPLELFDQNAFQEFFTLLMSDPVVSVSTWVIGGLASILGGYVAARIVKRNLLLNATAVSIYCILSGVSAFALVVEWHYVLIGIVVSPVLTLTGGYIRVLQIKHWAKHK